MICWWQETSRKKKNPGTVSKSTKPYLDGNNHLPATQVLKSQEGFVKPAVQAGIHENNMTYMCICTFYHVVSHEPVSKPNQTKPNQ